MWRQLPLSNTDGLMCSGGDRASGPNSYSWWHRREGVDAGTLTFENAWPYRVGEKFPLRKKLIAWLTKRHVCVLTPQSSTHRIKCLDRFYCGRLISLASAFVSTFLPVARTIWTGASLRSAKISCSASQVAFSGVLAFVV